MVPSRFAPFLPFRLPVLWVCLGAVLLFSACGEALYPYDCDQRLASGDYDLVLLGCDDPYYQALAYLGKAGFNLSAMANATDPSNVVEILGLTAENIDERRGFLNGAVEAVRVPGNSGEAFALLLSTFLGLSVTVTEYLDNGLGEGTGALDNNIETSEVNDFTGMEDNPGANQTFVPDTDPYFQVQVGDKPYTMICRDYTPSFPSLSLTLCDDDLNDEIKIYDDADGSGMLNTSSPPGAESVAESVVRAALPNPGIEVNMVIQMVYLELPFRFDAVKLERMKAFLGQGDPEGEITIGVLGYLDLMDVASTAMETFSPPPTDPPVDPPADPPAEPTVKEQIDTAVLDMRTMLDNGAECAAFTDPESPYTSLVPILDMLYGVYVTAPGTALRPAPADGKFTSFSIVPDAFTTLDGVGETLPLTQTDFVFAEPIGIKWLYPLVAAAGGAFNITNATPRVDQADATFQEHFEYIPLLTPSAATPLDGVITFAELLCADSDPASAAP